MSQEIERIKEKDVTTHGIDVSSSNNIFSSKNNNIIFHIFMVFYIFVNYFFYYTVCNLRNLRLNYLLFIVDETATDSS